jgi:hypothetical protein
MNMQLSSYPEMTPEEREKFFRKLKRIALVRALERKRRLLSLLREKR